LTYTLARYQREKRLKDGSRPEKYIQREILEWLKETGLLFWRQNSGTVFTGHRRVLLGDEGLPDIVCIVPPSGRLVGLEVKSANGKVRRCQKEFATRIREAGGLYFIVRTLAQAMEAVATSIGEEQWKQLQTRRSGR
jgi:hypothetical protein